MSLWGNADSAAITGTVTATNDSATVAGSSTVFTTVGQIDVGDLMMIVDEAKTVPDQISEAIS